METEITPEVKAIAEQYGVHPSIAKEMPIQQVVEEQIADNLETVADNIETTEQIQQESEPIKSETPQAKNFRELRLQKERAERERDELAKLLKQQSQIQSQDEDESSIAPDTLIEGKHLSKYDKKYKKLEQQNQIIQQQLQIQQMRYQLKNDFPDFDKVVNSESIEKFRDMHPELAKTLDATTDLYTAGASAYTLFKKFGIYVEDSHQNDRYKVQQNLAKPKPVVSASSQQGSSPLAKANAFANGLTKELEKQLLEEMTKARKAL